MNLYLDRRNLDLGLDGAQLIVRGPGQQRQAIALNLLQRVVIHGQAHIDTRLLAALGEAGIATVFLSGRRNRRIGLLTGKSHGDARRRVAQYRLQDQPERRLEWACTLVSAKLAAQQRLLLRASGQRPDLRKPLLDGAGQIRALLGDVSGSVDLETLRGREGAGAASYFGAFHHLFASSLGFTGRNRRPPRDPVNACLSLGYTLLAAEAAQACYATGLDPLLGFFHQPAYGRESLALDLMEPLRPRFDALVWWMFRKELLRGDQFTREGVAVLLNKAGRQTFYRVYESFAPGARRYLRRAGYLIAKELLRNAPGRPGE